MSLWIGAGEAEITPPPGTPFGGFALERFWPAATIHDPLFATATVVATAVSTIALVSCDLQTIAPDVVARLRAAIATRWAIPPAHLLIAATHVHSGPGGDASERQIPGVDHFFTTPEAQSRIEGGILAAVAQAVDRRQPAALRAGFGAIDGIGRRRHAPESPARAPAALLVAEDPANGLPLAVLASYGCHPSILGPDNTALSSDYPGVVRRVLSGNLGGVPVNFLNGPAGDISTRATRRATTFSEVERLGRVLAAQLMEMDGASEPLAGEPVAGAQIAVDVPVDMTLLPRLETDLAAMSGGDDPRARQLAFQVDRLRALAGPTVPCEVQVLRCGDIAFIGVAGEFFSEPGYALTARAPAPHVLVVAPANGTIGNLPPPSLHAQIRPIVAPEATRIIMDAAVDLCRDLYEGGQRNKDGD